MADRWSATAGERATATEALKRQKTDISKPPIGQAEAIYEAAKAYAPPTGAEARPAGRTTDWSSWFFTSGSYAQDLWARHEEKAREALKQAQAAENLRRQGFYVPHFEGEASAEFTDEVFRSSGTSGYSDSDDLLRQQIKAIEKRRRGK